MPRIRGRVKQAILEEARQPLTNAEAVLEARRKEALAADAAYDTQQTVVFALIRAYTTLEKLLAPQPRPSSSKAAIKSASKSTKKTGKKRGVITGDSHDDGTAAKPVLCGACGNVEDYEDHAQPSPHYHPFASGVRSAPLSSSVSNGATAGTVSSETLPEDVSPVAHAASEGASGD